MVRLANMNAMTFKNTPLEFKMGSKYKTVTYFLIVTFTYPDFLNMRHSIKGAVEI
jgi:hypothetical protein